MIEYLRGTLASKEPTFAVVEVNGIGYGVLIPMSTFDKLPAAGQDVELHTHLHVREDAMQLIGFKSIDERKLFLLVQSVSGVGVKLALNVLSGMSVASFCEAVVNADIRALSRINGIGKRSAERLVVELREKAIELAPAVGVGAGAEDSPQASSREAEDAVATLAALGYKQEAARKIISKLLQDNPDTSLSTQELVRKSLLLLNR
jgi:Holliday junction DNA helicase RuvA